MITTIVRAASHHIQIEVPQEFNGQDVQVVTFVEQKKADNNIPPKAMKDFWGAISPETAAELHEHVKKSREEWGRDIY